MIFSLEVRRARQGDCLLLHFGTAEAPELVIIDAGPATVYKDHLLPRLTDLKAKHQKRLEENGDVEDDAPLPVRMVMVSHVDDDHIQGILDLTRDLKGKNKRLLQTAALWHNSFEDLLGEEGEVAVSQFGAAAITSEPPDDDAEKRVDTYKVLASIPQGQKLRGDAGTLEWTLNPEFGEGLVSAGKDKHAISEALTFTVVGPMQPEIDKLRKAHAKWAAQQSKKGSEGAAALAAYADESVPNLSSIVVLARFNGGGKKKRILLTGDARGDKILKGLEHAGIVKKHESLHVDILKVPHHGSDNNVALDFFERITADHYVFSGNGEHGNPERDTLRMLLEARGDEPLTLHLTYPVKEIDAARKIEWDKQRASELAKKEAGTLKKKSPRKAWSRDKHSIKAFFEQHPLGTKQRLLEAPEKTPHIIDLLDRVRF